LENQDISACCTEYSTAQPSWEVSAVTVKEAVMLPISKMRNSVD